MREVSVVCSIHGIALCLEHDISQVVMLIDIKRFGGVHWKSIISIPSFAFLVVLFPISHKFRPFNAFSPVKHR